MLYYDRIASSLPLPSVYLPGEQISSSVLAAVHLTSLSPTEQNKLLITISVKFMSFVIVQKKIKLFTKIIDLKKSGIGKFSQRKYVVSIYQVHKFIPHKTLSVNTKSSLWSFRVKKNQLHYIINKVQFNITFC